MTAHAAVRKASERLAALKPSATVEMTDRVRQARAAGRKVIGLSSGDPNITTDPRIVAAAERALARGDTHYATPAGQPELREAITGREAARCGARYDPADILVTPGGKFALLAALMGAIEPGDEVIVPQPGWVSYGPCVRLAGGVPVALAMLDRIDPTALAAAVTPRTRAIILNSPANPTGRVLPADEVAAAVGLAQRHGLWLIFDQVYADLTYDAPIAFPQALDGGRECTLAVDSLSKTFGMTGWRLGYLAAPSSLARPILKFLQHSIYCVAPFIQAAGVEALALFDELAPVYRARFRGRLERAAARLSAIDGISCPVSDATFYLFPAIDGDDGATAKHWLDAVDVAVLPGSAFGAAGAGHLRLSLTASDEELEEAFVRIARAGIVK
ncbi:MAG TPA: aminotransferase class I/II-fold pyridoxal phosphate-dependent enzyme [Xanthobacteraceae bacterium]|nr:aminotransferase class I/II-fold pyridoxal phosphate-dependent enzyme [Xanthobacteraceae bacterium]